MTKKTAFYDKHIENSAKIVEFAGYYMPVSYEGINTEHKHVRNALGLFDVSHMGEFFLKGQGAEDWLQSVTINDVKSLVDNQAQYSAMCYENGTLIDDMITYRINSEEYMLVVNGSNLDKDFNWLQSKLNSNLSLVNRSDEYSLLAVQGPHAIRCLQKMTDFDISEISFYHFRMCKIAGEAVILSRTGYTGERGYEIYLLNNQAEKIWAALMDEGKEFDIKPIGLGARDTLRLEMKYCLYGNDIDETTNPLEAGIGWITKLKIEDDFIGKQALLDLKKEGLKRKLISFKMLGRGIPRHAYNVKISGGTIGVVTSGTQSPTLSAAIGLAYVDKKYSKIGEKINIEIRGKEIEAEIVKAPFVNSSPM